MWAFLDLLVLGLLKESKVSILSHSVCLSLYYLNWQAKWQSAEAGLTTGICHRAVVGVLIRHFPVSRRNISICCRLLSALRFPPFSKPVCSARCVTTVFAALAVLWALSPNVRMPSLQRSGSTCSLSSEILWHCFPKLSTAIIIFVYRFNNPTAMCSH